MRKIGCVIAVLGAVLLIACSVPAERPKEGLWYCEELRTSIDFSALENDNDCVRYYPEEGTYDIRKCLFDYGDKISICSADQKTEYLIGAFEYKDGVFTVVSLENKEEYVFTRVDESVDFSGIPSAAGEYSEEQWGNGEFIVKNGCVPDKETAAAVAQLVFFNLQKDGYFMDYTMKQVFFETTKQAWIVSYGPDEEGYTGTGLHIAISKADAQVIRVWADK